MQKREIERLFRKTAEEVEVIQKAAIQCSIGVRRKLEDILFRCLFGMKLTPMPCRPYEEHGLRPMFQTGLEFKGRRVFLSKDRRLLYWDWSAVVQGQKGHPVVLELSPERDFLDWSLFIQSEEVKQYLIRHGTAKGRPKNGASKKRSDP